MLNNLPKNWEWKKLGEVCDVKKGTSITKQKTQIGDIPVIAGGQQPAYYHNVANRTGKTITVSASGAYAGFVNYFEIQIFASDCTTIQSMDESKLLTKYVYLIIKSQQKKIYNDLDREVKKFYNADYLSADDITLNLPSSIKKVCFTT